MATRFVVAIAPRQWGAVASVASDDARTDVRLCLRVIPAMERTDRAAASRLRINIAGTQNMKKPNSPYTEAHVASDRINAVMRQSELRFAI